MNAIRSLYLWCATAAVTLILYPLGLFLFVVTAPFDPMRRVGHAYATRWARAVMRLNRRWHWEVKGAERIPQDRPLVLVANHQGFADIMIAFRLDLQFRWIAKSSIFYVPFLGWFMSHAGYIPLRRGRRNSVQRCMDRARICLGNGVSVLFFPEGTRSCDGVVGAFKSGAFRLAIEGGYDILPLAISGTRDTLPKNTWRFSEQVCRMRMQAGDPISTVGLLPSDIEVLANHTRQTIVALKEKMEGRATADSVAPARSSKPGRQRKRAAADSRASR